jgi:hypothetical protein
MNSTPYTKDIYEWQRKYANKAILTTVDSDILKNWHAGIHQRVFSVLRGLLGLTVDGAQVPIGKTEKIKKV